MTRNDRDGDGDIVRLSVSNWAAIAGVLAFIFVPMFGGIIFIYSEVATDSSRITNTELQISDMKTGQTRIESKVDDVGKHVATIEGLLKQTK